MIIVFLVIVAVGFIFYFVTKALLDKLEAAYLVWETNVFPAECAWFLFGNMVRELSTDFKTSCSRNRRIICLYVLESLRGPPVWTRSKRKLSFLCCKSHSSSGIQSPFELNPLSIHPFDGAKR